LPVAVSLASSRDDYHKLVYYFLLEIPYILCLALADNFLLSQSLANNSRLGVASPAKCQPLISCFKGMSR